MATGPSQGSQGSQQRMPQPLEPVTLPQMHGERDAAAGDEATGGPDNENDSESGGDNENDRERECVDEGSGDEDADEYDIEGSELAAMLQDARAELEVHKADRRHSRLLINHLKLRIRLRELGEDLADAGEICTRARQKLRLLRAGPFHVRRKRPRLQA